MTDSVPEGLMQRLVFSDEAVVENDIPPRIAPDLPVVLTPDEDRTSG